MTMKAIFCCLALSLGINACATDPETSTDTEPAVSADIIGEWNRPGWEIFRGFTFRADSTAVLGSAWDTVFQFKKFSIVHDSLLLTDMTGRTFREPIIALTQDSLVLGSLFSGSTLERLEPIRWSRVR